MSKAPSPGLLQSSGIKAVRDFFYNPSYANKSLYGGFNDIYSYINGMGSDGDGPVTYHVAETITAYFICLKIKAETFGSITTGVYKQSNERMVRDMSNPLDYLLSVKPAEQYNAYDWWFATQWLEDLHGNAYAMIQRDRSGRPSELTILDPTEVSVRQDKDQSIWYVYKGKAYPARDMLHFKQNSKNGITGRSDISLNRETLELSKKHESYSKRIFGKKPQAVFEDGENLTPEQATKISEQFAQHVKAGLVPMVWGGLKYKSVMIPPGDAQYIESRQFTKGDICAMKRIPLSMVQNYSREAGATYNNIGEQKASFYTDVILPGSRSKELEMLTKLIS